MFDLVKNIKPLVQIRSVIDKPIIDTPIFRLHYRLTSIVLFTCCAFVSAYTFFGEPIHCVGSDKGAAPKPIDTYCYLEYTYTLPNFQNKDPKLAGLGSSEGKKKVYNSYYRWIPLMLLLQAILFYLPHWIWKNWENKKIDKLTENCRGPVVEIGAKQKDALRSLAKYAADSLHKHNMFALMYYFCEILNFINVIVNAYLIDVFLGGEFMNYGIEVLNYTDMPQENRTDPMIQVFPRVTKCDFYKYGASGTVELKDYLCVLALNNLNEKIYIVLWFWLIVLACLSILPILYNVAVFALPVIRKRELGKHCTMKSKYRAEELIQDTQIGDFFLWDLMARNMSSKCYSEFINELYKRIKMEKE